MPRYFVDRSLGKKAVAEALRAAGATVEVHDVHFAQDTEDPLWITKVTNDGWVILTKDTHIRKRELEILALRNAGAAAFMLLAGQVTGEQAGRAFVAVLDKMARIVRNYERPIIAGITAGGNIAFIPPKPARRGAVKR